MRFSSATQTFRPRFDFTFSNDQFFPNPAGSKILPTDFVVASATELDANGTPISGGAHVTVQQVVPGNDQVIVRVWVDNVPVSIHVRCSVTILTE